MCKGILEFELKKKKKKKKKPDIDKMSNFTKLPRFWHAHNYRIILIYGRNTNHPLLSYNLAFEIGT